MLLDPSPSHARCSRRRFLSATGGATAGALLAGCTGGTNNPVFLTPAKTSLAPAPIPAVAPAGGLHVQRPDIGLGTEPSLITDFDGLVGRFVVDGQGLAGGTTLYHEADIGFMQGTFRAVDGTVGQGTFFFV